MRPRTWILIAAGVLLGLWYVLSFTEWVRPDPIQIQAQVREMPRDHTGRPIKGTRGNRPAPPRSTNALQRLVRPAGSDPSFGTGVDFEDQYSVVFALDGEYRLTGLRVMEVDPPGRKPVIMWELDSRSNSVPTKALIYGRNPQGLKGRWDENPAKKLEPGMLYRLELKAGRYTGSTTFRTKELPPPEEAQ